MSLKSADKNDPAKSGEGTRNMQSSDVKRRLSFSSLENQGDIQLEHAMSMSPMERLSLLLKLNEYAYRSVPQVPMISENPHIIFSRYEYFP